MSGPPSDAPTPTPAPAPAPWPDPSTYTVPVPVLRPARPRRAGRRGASWRRAWWSTAVFAVALLVAGTVVAVTGLWATDSPATVVRKYFAALRAGDAARALSLGSPPTGRSGLLSADVLRQQNRIAPLTVAILSVRTEQRRARVAFRVAAGSGNPVPDFVTLHRRSRQWAMDTTSHAVTITVPVASRRVTLAGQALSDGPVRLFPGVVPLTPDTATLAADPSAPIVTLSGARRIEAGPVVTNSGVVAVRSGVQAAMRRCLSLAAAAPASCPLRATGATAVPGSVRGRLTDDGDSPTVVLVTGNPDGALDVTGQFTVTGTSLMLDFENQPTTDRGTQLVPFRARVYAGAPGAVQWRAP